MRTIKRIEYFSFYDRTGVAKHLEDMAAKGWMLTNIEQFFWEYREIEPSDIHFTVTYYAQASTFDPELLDGQLEYAELSEVTGWKFICSNGQLQVYASSDKHPIPMETDPVTEISSLHQAMKKTYLRSYAILFIVGLLNGALFISTLLGSPIEVLASPVRLSTGVSWIALLVIVIMEVYGYFSWRRSAMKAAERGQFLETKGKEKAELIILAFVILGFFWWVISALLSGDSVMRWITLLVLVYLIGLMFIINQVKNYLKKRKISRNKNIAITLTVDVVLTFVFLSVITFGTVKAISVENLKNEASVNTAEVPLKLADFQEGDYSGYIQGRREEKSPLVSLISVYEHLRIREGQHVAGQALEYTIIDVKMPFLYDFCKDSVLKSKVDVVRGEELVMVNHYEPIDPSIWHADEAYQLHWSEHVLSKYILCYGNRIVEINFDEEPSQAQRDIIAERIRVS